MNRNILLNFKTEESIHPEKEMKVEQEVNDPPQVDLPPFLLEIQEPKEEEKGTLEAFPPAQEETSPQVV